MRSGADGMGGAGGPRIQMFHANNLQLLVVRIHQYCLCTAPFSLDAWRTKVCGTLLFLLVKSWSPDPLRTSHTLCRWDVWNSTIDDPDHLK